MLAGGELRGLWRLAKKGRRLQVTVEALAGLPADELAAEAERLAPFRAADSCSVTFDAV